MRAHSSTKSKNESALAEKRWGRKARELLDAIAEGGHGLQLALVSEQTYLYSAVPQIERLLFPAASLLPPKKQGRPRTTADLEDLVLALARVYIDAGGSMPASSFGEVFWKGIVIIKRELEKGGVRVPSVSAMENKAKKTGWRATLKEPKP